MMATPHLPRTEPTPDTQDTSARPLARPRGRDGTTPTSWGSGGREVAVALATVLVGLSAGFFFTYEASVTLGLAQVDDVSYVTTFQAINDTIRNGWFGVVFFGSIPAIGLALALSWRSATTTVRALMAATLALYLGCVAITGVGNIPLNDQLSEVASITPASAAEARRAFEHEWNRLNLIRTISVVASFVALVAARSIRRRPAS